MTDIEKQINDLFSEAAFIDDPIRLDEIAKKLDRLGAVMKAAWVDRKIKAIEEEAAEMVSR